MVTFHFTVRSVRWWTRSYWSTWDIVHDGKHGDRELVQWLRTLSAFHRDLSLIPSTYIVQLTTARKSSSKVFIDTDNKVNKNYSYQHRSAWRCSRDSREGGPRKVLWILSLSVRSGNLECVCVCVYKCTYAHVSIYIISYIMHMWWVEWYHMRAQQIPMEWTTRSLTSYARCSHNGKETLSIDQTIRPASKCPTTPFL